MEGWQILYELLNAVAFTLFGSPRWVMVVLNSFAALWTVIVAYVLARACFGKVAARVVAVLVALFPSMVLWSVLNIRDAIAALMVTLLVYAAVRVNMRLHLRDAVLLGIGFVLLSSVRDYMGVLVMAGVGLGWAAALRPGKLGSTFAMGTVLIIGLVFGLEQGGILSPEQLQDPLQSASRMRSGLQEDQVMGLAGSAFGVGYEINTPGQALRYLPIGLSYFLFAPFPWAITSTLQLITLPEVLLWYALTPFVVMGALRGDTRRISGALIIMSVLLVSVSTYALVEGNFGTAYRHRAQVMPLFFVLAGKGLSDWWARARAERLAKRARRARARSALLVRPDRR